MLVTDLRYLNSRYANLKIRSPIFLYISYTIEKSEGIQNKSDTDMACHAILLLRHSKLSSFDFVVSGKVEKLIAKCFLIFLLELSSYDLHTINSFLLCI